MLLAASGMYIHMSGGVSGRFPDTVVSLDSGSFEHKQRDAERQSVYWRRKDGALIYGAKVDPRFAVFGDSHSNVIALKLGSIAMSRGESLRHFYEFGAAPILGVRFASNPGAEARIEQSIRTIESSKNIDTVILAARWAYALHGFNTDFGAYERDRSDAPAILTPESDRRVTVEQATELFKTGIEQTVSRLRRSGKRVVIMYPTPEVGYHVPRTMARLLHYYGSADSFARPSDYYFRRQRVVFNVLDSLGDTIERIHPHEVFLSASTAMVHEDGRPLYRDDDHLTLTGAEKLMPMFENVLWTSSSADQVRADKAMIYVSAEFPMDQLKTRKQ